MIVNSTALITGGVVVVSWEPPLEGACPVVRYKVYHREVTSHVNNESEWNSVAVNRNVTSHTLHLKCWKEYEIAVTSLTTQGESDFKDSRIWKFKTKGGTGSRAILRLKFNAKLIANDWRSCHARGIKHVNVPFQEFYLSLHLPGSVSKHQGSVHHSHYFKHQI